MGKVWAVCYLFPETSDSGDLNESGIRNQESGFRNRHFRLCVGVGFPTLNSDRARAGVRGEWLGGSLRLQSTD
eukprot:3825779-Pyramimonas_sp.AAC.1